MFADDGVKCPYCPMCGSVGMSMPGVATAFCTSGDECPCWTWDPYRPAAVQLPGVEATVTGTMLCATCATVVDVRDVVWVDPGNSVFDRIAVCSTCYEANA